MVRTICDLCGEEVTRVSFKLKTFRLGYEPSDRSFDLCKFCCDWIIRSIEKGEFHDRPRQKKPKQVEK